jgi:hypothetical protein
MTPYEKAIWLSEQKGNNAFSFELRGADPKLFIPALREGRFEDLSLGREVVFEDVDGHGILQSCTGLEFLLRTQWRGVPTIVMDNHNHAFYFWVEAVLQGRLGRGATLVHVDQHKDMRRPETLFEGELNLEAIFDYTHRGLNVGNYIVPAVELGVVGERIMITGASDLDLPEGLGVKNKILNVDLDFFVDEMEVDFEKARALILAHLATANLVTIATSPFFMDQKKALSVLSSLVKN